MNENYKSLTKPWPTMTGVSERWRKRWTRQSGASRWILCAALSLICTLSPARCQAQDQERRQSVGFWVTAGLVMMAHSMDLAETTACRAEHRCVEANPWLMRFKSPSGFTLAKMPIAYGSLYFSYRLSKDHSTRAVLVNVAQAAVFGSLASRARNIGRPGAQ